MYTYIPKGVCTKKITFEIENNILKDVKFYSGCPGSQEAIGILVEGMPVDKVVGMLKGINCRQRGTSCPDQLVKAIENVTNNELVQLKLNIGASGGDLELDKKDNISKE